MAEDEEVKKRWRSYFKQLMNVINERVKKKVQPGGDTHVEEVVKTLQKVKCEKAIGPVKVPIEAWKILGSPGIDCLQEVFSSVVEKQEMPQIP